MLHFDGVCMGNVHKSQTNKPATPIKDLFDKEDLSKEDLEKRRKLVEKYGHYLMPIQSFIDQVLFPIHGEESTLSAFGRLLNDYGLVIYKDGLHKSDMEKTVSSKELLNKLEHRKTECLIGADDLVFWKLSLNKERNYYVYIDDVARAYCLAGNNTFDWYNLYFNPKWEMTNHPIPEEIKADIKRLSAVNNQDDIKHKNTMNKKERNTMLRLIIGMAIDAYGYNPDNNKNSATGSNKNSISSKLQQHGINIDNDTIGKYLKEAKELLER